MFKFFNAFRTKLTWYLVGCVLASGLVAFLTGYLVIQFGITYTEMYFDDEDVNRTFQKKYVEDLQRFIEKEQINVANISKVQEWTDENTYVYLAIYQKNTVIFNSDYAYSDTGESADNVANSENQQSEIEDGDYVADNSVEETEEEGKLLDEDYLYKIELADGTLASADIFCYDFWQYYYYVWAVGLAMGIVVFISIFTRLLKKKLNYINKLESELEILEGGNMEYPITVKGSDELGNLARGIEQMRLSVIENQRREQKMLQANKDLVTSMSHDLRTPLTTLTGYLEILNMQHVRDEKQQKQYLELSLEKTREIKELSDELFEYFLVYGENSKRISVEPISVLGLVEDLTCNQFLALEEKGYQFVCLNHLQENAGNCMIHVRYMQRVLNNIISNLEKYADIDVPIEVSAAKEQDYLVLRVRNGICKNLEPHESTKIGLITCERIMKLQRGEFQIFETEDEFTVKLVIPLERKHRKEG